MHLTIAEILEATGGSLLQGLPEDRVSSVSTDTRQIRKRDFYIALKGPRFDGHNFIKDAVAKGVKGLLVSQAVTETFPGSLNVVRVADTLKALGDLAWFWRKKFTIPVLAVTGSSGKTTTKEMIASCLKIKGPVCKTEGNLNNLVGLPLTLFGLEARHHYAVWEMGMNAFGEIARLTAIAVPTMGLITNVGRAHLEGVRNKEGVARAKSELFKGLQSTATAFVNLDDPFISKMPTAAKKLSFGFAQEAEIRCTQVKYGRNDMIVTICDPIRETDFHVPVAGPHQAFNWLACYSVCFHLGLDPREAQEGIVQFKPANMRGEEFAVSKNILVINDAYNANPDSMQASLMTLKQRFPDKRKIAVLGEMFELGEESDFLHNEAGEEAAKQDVFMLFAFGKRAPFLVEGFKKHAEGPAYSFEIKDELYEKLKSVLKKGDVVLVKGSRGSKMDEVVEFLKGI